MYRLPGLSINAAAIVVELAEQESPDWDRGIGRRKALTLVEALRCRCAGCAATPPTTTCTRTSRSPPAWRGLHQRVVAFLADALGTTDDELPALLSRRIFLIDGTLIPTFNWRHRKDLLSGKHRKHGSAQLFVDVHGRIIAVSRTFPGSWHDIHCLREAGWVDLVRDLRHAVGDGGYQGEPDAIHTPIKKKPGIDLTDHQKEFNTAVARIRVGVEWGVGDAKNWRILAQKLNERRSGRRHLRAHQDSRFRMCLQPP